MTDPRTSPDLSQVLLDEPARIVAPVVDLTRGQDGPRDRQLIYGDQVTVLNRHGTHCLIRAEKDGYCGTVIASVCGAVAEPTHKITARAAHAYVRPDIKSPDTHTLSFGARITAISETATFIETELGFIPRQHLHRVTDLATDPAMIAALFLGTPYLWGGNSHLGIDCSGLVQAALLACGIPCPGDSDQQQAQVGTTLAPEAPLMRNDLIFWKGHVALVTDGDTLIHANAGHMSVVYEPITQAFARIEAQGDGRPTDRKRLRAM